MKEQFVTYEIALKLKELGFDESCIAFYYIFKEEEKFLISTISNTNSSWNNGYIAAPLWQQAIDWLREKHNICISQTPSIIIDSWVVVDKHSKIIGSFTREKAILKALELCKNN